MDKIVEDILKQRIALNNTPDLRKYKYILRLTMKKWYELMSSEEASHNFRIEEEGTYYQDMLIEAIPKDEIKVVVHEKDGSVNTRYEEVLTVIRGDLDG